MQQLFGNKLQTQPDQDSNSSTFNYTTEKCTEELTIL